MKHETKMEMANHQHFCGYRLRGGALDNYFVYIENPSNSFRSRASLHRRGGDIRLCRVAVSILDTNEELE